MSDIFDALIGGSQVDPAELAQSLRKKQALGALASMTGIEGLQKLGPQMTAEAASGAQDYAALRDRTANQKLQRLQAYQNELDRQAAAQAALEDRKRHDQEFNATRLDAARIAAGARADNAAIRAQLAQDKLDLAAKAKRDAAENISAMYDDLIAKATTIRDNPALGKITGIAGSIPNWPGGAAADVAGLLHSLTSEQALNTIQSLRQNGGTLGRVTNMEIPLLQSSVAPLASLHSMSTDAAKKALDNLITYSTKARSRLRSSAGIVDDPQADAGAPTDAAGPATLNEAGLPPGNPNDTNPSYNAAVPPFTPAPARALPRANPAPAPAANASGLTPAEADELAALKKRFRK
jgi:hypothetical protein